MQAHLELCQLLEYVPKESGVKRAGGYACKYCDGFWKAQNGQQHGGHSHTQKCMAMQLILDEPPEQLYNQRIKDRMASYLRVEPVGAIRDEARDLDYPVKERLRFSTQNNLASVSDIMCGVLLSNPERDGFLKIQQLAGKRVSRGP